MMRKWNVRDCEIYMGPLGRISCARSNREGFTDEAERPANMISDLREYVQYRPAYHSEHTT